MRSNLRYLMVGLIICTMLFVSLSSGVNVIPITKVTESSNKIGMEATCTDGVKNGKETDIDCGGSSCSACADGKVCIKNRDCSSHVCTKGICQVSSKQPVTTQVGSKLPGGIDGNNSTGGPISGSGVLQPVRPVNIAPPGPISPTYNFVLDSLKITNTRSLHEDTDYANWGVAVSGAMVSGSPKTKFLGDLNSGTHPIGLAIGPIAVPNDPNIPVTITLQVVNSGHTDYSTIVNTLSAGAGTLVGTYVDATAGAATAAALKYLGGIIVADCDGPVAVDKIVTNGQELASISIGNPYTLTTYYPGTDSPTGCGSNSQYYVTWHVEKVSEGGNTAAGGLLLKSISSGGISEISGAESSQINNTTGPKILGRSTLVPVNRMTQK